jgi:hypothetical protein
VPVEESIDRVVIRRDTVREELSFASFLALPLNQRIALILERTTEFYSATQLMERQAALKIIRTLRK